MITGNITITMDKYKAIITMSEENMSIDFNQEHNPLNSTAMKIFAYLVEQKNLLEMGTSK